MKASKKLFGGEWGLVLYFSLFLIWGWYSFSRVDLNLTLFDNPLFLNFNKVMTDFGYFNRPLACLVFFVLVISLFGGYILLYLKFKREKKGIKSYLVLLGGIILVLVLSYPALSYDIYNYIFNAKMVLVYQADPHKQVALDFATDSWIRFMHNVHTPAPYFYGWTGISLLPSYLGFNKFVLTLLNFKLFEIPFFLAAVYYLAKIGRKMKVKNIEDKIWLFAFNPLILIEVFGNGHNDFVMMSLALIGFWFLVKDERRRFGNLFWSLFFLGLSITIKYVTVLLIPLYIVYFFRRKIDIGSIAAVILFLAILTRPSDQFHPWYIIWGLSFAVLARKEFVFRILLFFSFGLLLRYLPWIYSGGYSNKVLFVENLITYLVPVGLYLGYKLWWEKKGLVKS